MGLGASGDRAWFCAKPLGCQENRLADKV